MAEEDNNNTSENEDNSQQGNTSTSKEVILACDTNNENDQQCQDTVASIIEQGGYKVTKLPIGPNEYATYSYSGNAKGKLGVYMMAASLLSFLDAAQAGFDYNVLAIRGDVTNWTDEEWKTKRIQKDHHGDCTMPECDKYEGKTYPELNEIYKDRCVAVPGETCEKLGQNVLAALGGQVTGGTTQTTGATVVKIPDLTFYGLIKQIIGAIDGVFIIANNMAYLLSFQDLYKYRDMYEEYIPEIKISDILVDGIQHNWTTDGFYNAVEVTYADGIIRYQHDVLIELYGESTFYYEFTEDDEETAKAKAHALLSAHIRDYSLDIHIDCLYNPNITVGSLVKIPKTLTNTSTTSQRDNSIKKVYQAPEKKVRKGVTISDINIISNEEKTVEHITTEDGEEYDVEIEEKDYEIYFVQGYRMRWTPKQAPIMHLHLKFGPDTPEDPVNATIGVGGVQTGSSTGGAGQYGDDCFGVETAQLEGDYRIPHSGAGGIEYATQNPPDSTMTAGRCKQGSAYEKEVAGKTPEEAFYIASGKFLYCCYADNCSKYSCNDERWTSGECGFNCGDCATILKSVLDCVGVKNWIFHIDGHYHNMAEIGGSVKSVDLSRTIMSGGDSNTHTVGWPAAHNGSCGCQCHSC